MLVSAGLFSSCGGGQGSAALQAQVSNLQDQVNHTFKPPFWLFMLTVQMHHNKLWFAGTNDNWPLAQFNYDKIKEAIADIQKYEVDSPQTKSISMIDAPLNQVQAAIKAQDADKFKQAYINLTNTCNTCHQTVKYPMNVIKVPEMPQFTDQEFKPKS